MGEIGVSLSGWDIKYRSRAGHLGWCNQPAIGEVDALQEFVRVVNPDIFVELGTRYAGTVLALHDAIPDARIYSFDKYNTREDEDLVHDGGYRPPGMPEYDDQDTWVRRSWFPGHVRFLRLDFLEESEKLKAIVDRQPGDLMICFPDGCDKPAETALYMDWLAPGDIMAVNNWEDECGGAEALDALLGPEYERFMWDWSEHNLVWTRAWIKL